MEIWLKQNGNKIQLPVNPSEYSVKTSQINTPVNVNALGDINLLGNRGLAEIGFSSFFPYRYESYCEYRGIDKPLSYVRQIEEMKQAGAVRLIITRTTVNFDVTIESFEYSENDGTGDISYTFEFKEYRRLNIPVSALTTEQPAAQEQSSTARSQPETTNTTTYTVVKGDNLTKIARRLTGSTNWRPIYEQNKGVIGGTPNLIYPGQVLTITGAKA